MSTRATWLWFGAAAAGFAVGCLVYAVANLRDVTGLALLLALFGFFFVPYVTLLVGAVGALTYWRIPRARVRSIAAVVFAVAWAGTQSTLSQLNLAGVV